MSETKWISGPELIERMQTQYVLLEIDRNEWKKEACEMATKIDALKAGNDELTRYNAAILDQNNTLSTEKKHLMALMVEKEKVFAMENERLRVEVELLGRYPGGRVTIEEVEK